VKTVMGSQSLQGCQAHGYANKQPQALSKPQPHIQGKQEREEEPQCYSNANNSRASWWERVRPEHRHVARAICEQCNWRWARQALISSNDLEQYQLFLLCKFVAHDTSIHAGQSRQFLSPSAEIEQVWQQHMLRPQLYI
jgi:hypothetical protein